MTSILTTSATPESLAAAAASGADWLVLDLAIDAREAVAQALRARAPGGPRLMVRVNALDSGLIEADLDAVVRHAPDAILLPQAMGGADAQHLSVKIAVREAEAGLPDGAIAILPVVERAGALLNLAGYRGATRRLMGLTWSAEALARDLGASAFRLVDGGFTQPLETARSLTLFAAKAAGVPAFDTSFEGDDAGLQAECARARRDGFAGKMAASIEQAAVIGAVFAER